MADKLDISDVLSRMDGWTAVPGDLDAVQKRFKFDDFKTAWAFMSACALKAEQMDHHPEWFNVYNKVEVTLTTHDAGGVTALDETLGGFMDALAAKLS
ncbi:MAG: 4a-hydroxytetrahydrobiopterin dehydratase [Pseudomonadota bacterium]